MHTPENEPAAIARDDRGGKGKQTRRVYGESLAAVKCSACGGHGTRLRRTGFEPEDPIISETCEACGGSGGDLIETHDAATEAPASVEAPVVGGGNPDALPVAQGWESTSTLRIRLNAILKGPWTFRDLDQMIALYEQLKALTAQVDRQVVDARATLTALHCLQFDVSTRAEATRLLVRQLSDGSPSRWEEANLTRLLKEGGPEV